MQPRSQALSSRRGRGGPWVRGCRECRSIVYRYIYVGRFRLPLVGAKCVTEHAQASYM